MLDIVRQMPDKLDDENKNTKLDKIYQSAERSGLKDVFGKSLESKRTDLASLRVGEATFDDDTELSEQELQKVEELREKVIDLTELAPENLLRDDTYMVVPSRPAPYEVLQISKGVDPKEFYSLKNQLETWGDGNISLGERNNVDDNLIHMLMYRGDMINGYSRVYDYDGDLSAAELQKYYKINENGSVIWGDDLYQKSEVPPALPWLQSLIDREIFAKNDLEELDSVQKAVDYAKSNEDFIRSLIATEREAKKPIFERYEKMQEGAKAIRLPMDQMYFVASHHDLEDWLRVMARTGVQPKGILLYDDNQVILENFASQYEDNHKELSHEIGQAVAVDQDFCKDQMDLDPENTPRSGDKEQVLLESAVKRDKIVQLDKDHRLEVVSAE